MSAAVPRAVFDCVVLLQAAVSTKGPAFACKKLVDAGKVSVFLSAEVLAEITDVLHRPELQRKFKFTPERAEAFLRDLVAKTVALAEIPKHFSYPRDPDDEPYINLALAAAASYVVTWDKDLLDLMDETQAEGCRGSA